MLLVAIAVAAHLRYWYGSRVRVAEPSAPALAVLEAADSEVALWVAFPHQTLPALERRILGGDGRATVALFRLAGARPPEMPAFGPLTLPPSREVAVAWRSGDEATPDALWAAADVYPLVAAFARLAGSLAGNPWLTGGAASRDERAVTVGWSEGWWTIAPEGLGIAEPSGGDGATPRTPALALLRWAGDGEVVPPGAYALVEDDAGFVLASGAVPTPAAGAFAGTGLALLRWDGEARRALALLAAEGELDLPRAVGIHRPGGGRFPLPGEQLLALTGRRPRRERHAGRVVESLDRSGLAAGRELAPRLDAVGPLDRLLWLDVPLASREVGRIAAILGEVPLVPRRKVEPWQDAALVLAALDAAGWRSLTLAVEGPAARLALTR